MEENENVSHESQHDDNRMGVQENGLSAQAPSSLLSTVLQRLKFVSEQAPHEIAVDDLMAKLKSADWQVRAAAVRTLGRLEGAAPVDLLAAMLNDEDESVRAAAVNALGNSGSRAPLHTLVAALHDPDWHVRETAVYALGKQGSRVPSEILSTALHDPDDGVREAARLALRWREAATGVPEIYGKLWEQTMMQYNGHDRDQAGPSGDKGSHVPFEYVPYDAGDGAVTSRAYAARPHALREPAQAYGPPPRQGAFQLQEYAPRTEAAEEQAGERGEGEQSARYAYDEEMPSRAEKVTSFLPRRKSNRMWWIILAATAIIFFLGGISVSTMGVRFGKGAAQFGKVASALPTPVQKTPYEVIYAQPYVAIFQNEVASALHLTPDQVRALLQNNGGEMIPVAQSQGVSVEQLHQIELQALQDVLNQANSSGSIDERQVLVFMKQLQNNSSMLDKLTTAVFLIDAPQDKAIPTPAPTPLATLTP
ncbi:MAG TPA: HEAT repeat domain-containing protein [Ktedonobacteraceae bacterium]|nr:HEAT repeat domain-containing protein [Ktedonobacteraceae bacterium]